MKKTFAAFAFIFTLGLLPGLARAGTTQAAQVKPAAGDFPTIDISLTGPDTNDFAYTDTTVGAPTFNRPLANGTSAPTAVSGVGTAVSYSAFTFVAPASGSFTFLSTSVTPTNWDNYTVLYLNTFTPAAPLTNALIANDDNPSIGKSGFNYTLTAGSTYVFVTTGFANTDAGSFNDAITAPVPEPGTCLWVAAGMAGLCLVRRVDRRVTAVR